MTTIARKRDADERRRLRSNLQDEVDGAAVYLALAEVEADPNVAAVYRQLAEVEGRHAALWRAKLKATGERADVRPSLKARLTIFLARRLGVQAVLPGIALGERSNVAGYQAQPDAVRSGLPADEAAHARVLQAALSSGQGMAGTSLARLEGRHRGGGGNALRAAVLGANDGLVSNLCLVMGFAGAAQGQQSIVLAGLAGLAAGAGSMAMGEWLSVTSSRELAQRQIAAEAAELAQSPDDERDELALIYRAKGLSEAEAGAVADKLLAGGQALDTLVREELGIDPRDLGGSAWTAAATSFALFAFGAALPLLPFLLLPADWALPGAIAASAAALLGFGAVAALFTGRGLTFSAFRQLAFGAAAAALTYGIGALAGVALG